MTENSIQMSVALAEVAASRRDQEQVELYEMVVEYTIATDEDYDIAAKTLQLIKGRMKEIDAERTDLVKPLRDTVSKLNSYFSPALKKLEEMETRIKRLISDYQLKKREEQQRLLRAAAEEAAKQKVTDVAPPAAAVTLMEAARVAAPPSAKGVSAAEVWLWEVTDESKVPREFLSVDPRKLNAAAKAGEREIPGVRVYADVRITARASK